MDPGGTPNMIRAESPSKAEKKPVRLGFQSQPCAEISANQDIQKKTSISSSGNQRYANPPIGVRDANLPAARGDVTTGSAAATSSNGAARVLGNWADYTEDLGPGEDDDFTVVKNKKRRRERSSTGWAPRAEEVRTTRAHIAEARARQASSTEDHCVFVERSPELEPYHYMRAIDRMFGSTREVFQVTKMNGHFLVGLANRGMAERLVNEGLEVEGTLHRAFPFRKRAERITVGNLPFFVGDAAVISALSSFGRVTSIAPKLMKAGPYVYNDGRREAFIILREGMTIEGLPTRLDISIKGEAWPAYLSSGIRCSRCRGQGHRRANCPLLARRTNAPGPATPTSPTSVPSATAPGLPQQPSAQPPPSASPSPTMELSDVPPASRAALLQPAAPRPPPPAPLALPVEDTSPAPPPVMPAPSLRAPGGSVSPQSSKSEPSARDIEMTAIEESSASSTSSSRTSMRDDLVAFIQRSPTVSFTGTDALGLGREEVLDLLSSRTKAQRKRSLLTPPQTDALSGLIKQILGLKPAGNTNVYKILHQVKSELKKGPAAVPPTPPLPAPRPAGPTPPVPHGVETKPAMTTPPPPLPTPMEEEHVDHEDLMEDLFDELNSNTELKPLLDSGFSTYDLIYAILHRNERALLIAQLSPSQKIIFADRGATRRASSAFFASGECMDPGGTPNMIRAESPSKAEKKPVRLGFQAQLCADLSAKENIQKNISISSDEFQKYVNPPAGGQHANPAAPTNFDTASFSEAAAQANRSWADLAEDNNPEHEDNYTTVQRKKRRRGSAESPAAAAPSSNIRGAGAIRRPRSSTGWAPRAEEIRTTRAHIAEARARQASSTEDHCVYVERSPELEPFHYMRAIERMFGSTREVFQVTKMNGHFLVGLANRGMAERLVNEGLEVEGTLHRAFPFRKRAERITVGNLPFFVGNATVISALSAFGRVTSIAPKLMKAGPYIYNDGRREAFIILREGMTIEGLPTRLNITIKGEAWPAYLSSGIRCSRCRGQGHRRANCPLLAGRTNAPGPATPTSPTGVPSATAPGLPQQPSAQPPPSASPSPTMELSDVPPASRAALLPPAAPRPPPPAPLALPVEDTSPAPPPVIPAPSLRAPGGSVSPQSTKSGPPAQDIEMTAIEESSASSTSSSRTSMRDDLVASSGEAPPCPLLGRTLLVLGGRSIAVKRKKKTLPCLFFLLKNMTYLAKVRKCDLSKLAYELGEVVPPESRIVDLKRLILNSQSYEEEFAKQLLETLIEEREQTERAERERMEQTAQTEQAERIERERIEDRKRIEDRERIERKEQMVMEFELEKLRIQTTRGNNDTSRSTSNDAHYEIRKLMPKYESKDNDLSFYLILFERQAKRLGLDEDQWAFSLLGLLPYEMTQLIARETEEQSGDYRFVKRLLLKRYKLSPEQFRQKFEKHERSQKGSWRDFAFELRGYFNEWIEGMNVENFDALKDLSVTNQLKKKVPNVLRNHLIDDWTKLNNPDELADKLDEYENVRTEMGPPHWNAKHLIPPSFQQKSARFPNQSEVKETKQGTNVSGQDAARNEISETYPNTLRRMVNRAIRNDKGEPKCFNCNQFGHIARDCPAPRTTLTSRGCGQTGHKERNCTRPKEGLKVANLEVEGLETVPPDVYLKDVKIDNKETVKAMIDTGSSSCLMRESVARRISVDIEPDSTSLYGIGNQTAPAARTVGKTTVDLEIDGIVGREITVFIVNDDAQPYDLLIGRTWTDLPYVSFARIGKNLHIGYSSEFPFANLQEEIKSRRIELRATETVQLESDSINFTSAITDEVKDGYVLFTGVDDACVDSLLEVVDGKTTVPIISAGKGKLRVRKNQCVGRVELLNLDDIVVNLDVAEDSFQTKNEEKREGQDQMKRKRPILPEDINVNHSLTSKERQEILDVVNEYRDCFALGMEELGCTDVTKMDIKEVDGSKPVCLRPYKTTASEREAIREIVREWKDNGIVTETRSPYASPVLLVRKKTGDHRLVVDYRRLNIQTVKDKFPLPRIDDLLEGLRNAKFFTTLDLAHGYLQIPLTDKAKLKTAFITPDDTGQFERMIFGLANAPAEFQRLMHTVLGPLLNKKAFCYLDDVIIPAKDWREMIERLREVLERIRSAKLTLKPSKCEFGRREVEFLGYVISTGGLKPGPRKIKAIEEFPEPKNVHDIRRFLGLTNFFRRFVKDFARKAEPLSRLTKKGSQFEWKEEQRRSFGGLRKDLVEYPVLAHYNPELKTEVHCDASAEGLAGMVLQMDEDCKWRLVYCVSKKTTEAEKMYHSSKLELMAIVWTLDRLRQFLVGIKFTVVTDCQALVYMNARKTTNPQIARWYNLIQEYDFEIRHKPGEKMAHVDGMSRAPVDDPRDTMEEIVEKNLEVCLTITLEEQILMIQHSDPELRDLIQIFRKDPCDRTVGEQNRINDYSYKGGRLFRMVKNGEEERALYVIPKSMRKSLVVKFHDLMGHFATDRTVNKIKELYWFPSMKRYVRRHVAMCLECLFNKVPGGKQQGFLHPIKSGKRPFSIVHMDHVGPFVRSTKGNQELLVIVDNLTRFVRLSPVRNTSTQNVLKVMKSFVNDFGLPDKIISDRGSCFTSRQFEEFCRGNGIHHTLNSTKHPQGNGMVERVNRTVLSTIATSIEDPRRKDWDLKIKEVERDLNNAVNKTTNKTPFETLHGYSPRFHDGILRRLADEDVDPWTEPDRIQESVRSQIENKQEIMKTYYDKKRCRTIQFEVGEIVVMRHVPKMTGEPTKAQPKYRGPLIITEVLPSDTYRVTQLSERTSGRFYTTTAHISQLKSWHSEEDDSATEESPDEEPEVEDTPRRNPRRSCNARFNRGRLKSRNGRIKKRLRKPTVLSAGPAEPRFFSELVTAPPPPFFIRAWDQQRRSYCVDYPSKRGYIQTLSFIKTTGLIQIHHRKKGSIDGTPVFQAAQHPKNK
ncbi:hypothetical protein LAZ67_18000268, partial [Cordylochernes scorpioides]